MILEKYLSYFAPVILFPLPVFKITHHTSYVKHHILYTYYFLTADCFYIYGGRPPQDAEYPGPRAADRGISYFLSCLFYFYMLLCSSAVQTVRSANSAFIIAASVSGAISICRPGLPPLTYIASKS